MTPFTRQTQPLLARLDQMRDPKAGACAIDGDGFASHRRRATQLNSIRFSQYRHRHRDGGEVVDHLQASQPEIALHLADGELPAVVGHGDPVTVDGAGDGDAGFTHRYLVFVQIETYHGFKAGMGQT